MAAVRRKSETVSPALVTALADVLKTMRLGANVAVDRYFLEPYRAKQQAELADREYRLRMQQLLRQAPKLPGTADNMIPYGAEDYGPLYDEMRL